MEQLAIGIPPMTREEKAVAAILTEHRGRAKAIMARRLAELAGLDERRLRQVIKHLVERHHMAIGSTTSVPPGYYLITDPRERAAVRRSLMRRALSILERARAYDRAGWVHQLAGQLALKIQEDEEGWPE